jgi:DNA polymerase-3 subunit beta
VKCIVPAHELQSAVDLLRLAAKETPVSPTAGAVMIEAEVESQMLRLRTDNSAIHIQAGVPAKVATSGTVVISAQRLNQLLLLATGESVRLFSDDQRAPIAEVECGSTNAQLPCWPVEEFLARTNAIPLTDYSLEPSRCELSLHVLQDALHDVRQCWQRDSTAGNIHQGIHFKGAANHLKIEACDGRMLHISYLDVENLALDAKVDTKFVDIIGALSEEEGETCILSFYGNACTLELGEITVRSQYLEGTYPDTENNLMPPSEWVITVPKDQLIRALKLVQIITPREIPTARIQADINQLVISAMTPEVGQVREVINVKNTYKVTFNIDAARLLSTLKCIEADDVILQVDDPLSSAIIREGPSFIAVIALIRTFEQVSK